MEELRDSRKQIRLEGLGEKKGTNKKLFEKGDSRSKKLIM